MMLTKVQLLSALGALIMADSVAAHGHVMNWIIDDISYPGFNPSNPAQYGPTAERPTDNDDQGFVKDITSPMVACGGVSAGSALETWDVAGGAKVVAEWDTWPESHHGSVIEYMASCGTSCDGVDAASLTWFKISEASFEGGAWAADTIAATKKWEFTIPDDIPAGAYLVRHEILAMHSSPNEPQIYPYCFQANVASSGSTLPSPTTTFPEAYNLNDVFKTWSLYDGRDQSTFVAPGPAVYSGGSGSSPAPAPSGSSSASASVSASSAAESSATSSNVPSSTAGSTEPTTSPAEGGEYPTEPTASAPAESAPASSAASSTAGSASSASSPSPSSSTGPAIPSPGSGNDDSAMGGSAPFITENNGRFEVNGGTYNDRSSAQEASCMIQMNKCKNWANALPNAEVAAAFSSCDTQKSSCSASGTKRDVINRYSKRSLRVW